MDLFLHYLTMPYLLQGIGFTIEATVLGLAGGLAVGLVLAGMQLSRFWFLSAVARAYTVIFRGTPLILQLVFAYDALPHIGLRLSPIGAAGLALAFNEAPFIAEILRSGVLGVESGQRLAGQALGMTPLVLMRHVIAPQAIRIMVPALGNEAISALKNSSLASVISVEELTLRSTQLASSTFDFFAIFFASGLIYLGLTGAVSGIQLLVESWLDLDRPAGRARMLRLLPWVRPPQIAAQPSKPTAPTATSAAPPPAETAVATSARMSAGARSAHSAAVAHGLPMIEVQGLRKKYGDHAVLNGIDLTIRSGEVVALLGPSGSGKSTLLRCINHLEQWDSGVVRVGGRRVGFAENGRRLSPRAVAQERADIGVGMVFQQFNLFSHVTARENIAGPLRWVHGMLRSAANRRATELLERVGLTHRADALPRHMSGGQQQRVAIARAIAPNPSVLLLDEPTSALDPELVNEVLDVIRRLAVEDGLTMIISTHQLRFAYEVADRVVFLDQGVIIEEGPAQEMLSAPRHPLTARFLQAMGAERVSDSAPASQLADRFVT
ncbi:MAG: ABC transporter permease [Rhodospirillales bacterium 20-64-7]|nr:MAG: ABC transporter permease [Rhodospirillales bacterium 20-64-7]HQT75789.1 amino acid ABC transporter permease/ATP-binding protein [Rhodopila sp.]